MNEFVSIFKVNERIVKQSIKAERIDSGDNIVLFEQDTSPAKNTPWVNKGFTIEKFLSENKISTFKFGISNIVEKFVKKYTSTSNFNLEKYHLFVDNTIHGKIIGEIQAGSQGIGGIPLDLFPIEIELVEDRISQICGVPVTCRKTSAGYPVRHFWIRIIRPNVQDNNPPHRDVHLDRSRGAVNLYFPIAGSNENSSLPIIPESHFWPESHIVRSYGDTYVNDIKFTNPATVYSLHGLNLVTPNPGPDEAMVFTTYAIHGGGYNFNEDMTRLS